MSLTSLLARGALMAFSISALSQIAWCQSIYAGAFENLRKNRNIEAFEKEISEANQHEIDIRPEIPFLLGLLTSDSDILIQDGARSTLTGLAYSFGFVAGIDPQVSELFRPVMPSFESHLDEALLEPADKPRWSLSIALLTFAGVQPSSQAHVLFYHLLESKSKGTQATAVMALARLRPLPDKARKAILSRIAGYDLRSRMEILSLADDPELTQMFLKYLESDDPDEQRLATHTVASLGTSSQLVLDTLRRLQQRKNLDEGVAGDVAKALDHVGIRIIDHAGNKAPAAAK